MRTLGMRRYPFIILLIAFSSLTSYSQPKTKNLIFITLDGLRWQELFQGADSSLLFNDETVKDKNIINQFWGESQKARREKLLPFFWNVMGEQGQLYGNREYRNRVNCANPHWFSYPGYSEILTGFVDPRIKSNAAVDNPNETFLDFIYRQPHFECEVAAFATWEVFPHILREESGKIPVNAGHDLAEGAISDREQLLNELRDFFPSSCSARYDAFTFFYAFEYLKRQRPRVLYIAFDETDAHAHGGRYDEYLKSAYRTDAMIAKLWKWVQSDPEYKDQTTLLITTDHGRGTGDLIHKMSWRSHGRLAFGSGQIWMAVLGPDTPALGEMKDEEQYYQKQIAKTAAVFLGLNYTNNEPVGEVVDSMFSPARITSTTPVQLISNKK